jgi:hypothetical protein
VEEQNSYRSEICGMLSILAMVDLFVTYYNITSGSIDIACDGASALNKIFSCVSVLSIDDPCYDLIFSAQTLWKNSPLIWKPRHVKGHQDDNTSFDKLDPYSKLNVEMDSTAKAFMPMAYRTPCHFTTVCEPWSIWVNNHKLTQELDSTVYDLVHGPDARSYWANKHNVQEEVIHDVNWPAL